jgi:Ca2+-binding RTX toxin-like protein
MLTTVIKGFEKDSIVVDDANNVVRLAENATAVSGILEQAANPADLHDNSYVIDGWLLNNGSGISLGGDHDTVSVGETGHVLAGPRDLPGSSAGILLKGDANQITNFGEIKGGDFDAGILVSGSAGSQIHNSGLITGGVGIDYEGDQGLVVNESSGVVIGSTYAFGSESDDAGSVTFVNHGLVIGTHDTAIMSETETMILTNDGTIRGDVDFGDGGGRIDNRGGTITGAINGGIGNDMLITNDASYHLTEQMGHGIDTVKSTVSYTLDDNVERLILMGKANISGVGTDADDVLRGNSGNNSLTGLDGLDSLFGGKGNDLLSGGNGADTFGFATGFGKDTIQDFTPGDGDIVNLHGWAAIDSFSTLLDHATDHGDDVWITAGQDTLVIDNFHKADLSGTQFQF